MAEKETVSSIQDGQEAYLILAETPFYAESGGQIADKGLIFSKNGEAEVLDVQKAPNGQNLHRILVKKGTVSTNEQVTARVDESSRQFIIKNHTATHLLHQALKDVLGTHVNQAGSLVTSNRLRFDFSHFGAITEEEIVEIEQLVNEKIWASIPVMISNKKLAEAKEMGCDGIIW